MKSLARILILAGIAVPVATADTSILLIAGPDTGGGELRFLIGCELLARHLEGSGLGIKAETSLGWPSDPGKITAADSIVIHGGGVDDHVAKGHIAALGEHMQAGKGLAVLHSALEPGDPELAKFLDETVGGHFDPEWSVSADWQVNGTQLTDHPATRGVSAFELEDRFHYHLRLREDAVPLVRALPPESTLGADDGPRAGNPAVRKALADKTPQTLAWVVQNPDKSRGFGFTGGRIHANWANPDFLKLVLNGIVWTAGIEVPEKGVTATIAAKPAFASIDEAVSRGTPDDVRLFVTLHPESLQKGARENSRTPLEQAVLRNKPETAALLLDAGADPNVTDASQRTPLHTAIQRNNPAVVAALLKAGATPDPGDKDGWTPLHHAAAKNQPESAKILIEGGADPTKLSALGGTPLHEAAASGGKEIIELLLTTKIDPSLKSKQDVTALDLAREYKNQAAIDILGALD
jgi:hypothetical protein